MHRPPLSPRKYSWYSFLLEAESSPGPQCGLKNYVNEKFQWHYRELNPRPSNCATACPIIVTAILIIIIIIISSSSSSSSNLRYKNQFVNIAQGDNPSVPQESCKKYEH
jgi:hypothetical protein